jgi:hypothetical protein
MHLHCTVIHCENQDILPFVQLRQVSMCFWTRLYVLGVAGCIAKRDRVTLKKSECQTQNSHVNELSETASMSGRHFKSLLNRRGCRDEIDKLPNHFIIVITKLA